MISNISLNLALAEQRLGILHELRGHLAQPEHRLNRYCNWKEVELLWNLQNEIEDKWKTASILQRHRFVHLTPIPESKKNDFNEMILGSRLLSNHCATQLRKLSEKFKRPIKFGFAFGSTPSQVNKTLAEMALFPLNLIQNVNDAAEDIFGAFMQGGKRCYMNAKRVAQSISGPVLAISLLATTQITSSLVQYYFESESIASPVVKAEEFASNAAFGMGTLIVSGLTFTVSLLAPDPESSDKPNLDNVSRSVPKAAKSIRNAANAVLFASVAIGIATGPGVIATGAALTTQAALITSLSLTTALNAKSWISALKKYRSENKETAIEQPPTQTNTVQPSAAPQQTQTPPIQIEEAIPKLPLRRMARADEDPTASPRRIEGKEVKSVDNAKVELLSNNQKTEKGSLLNKGVQLIKDYKTPLLYGVAAVAAASTGIYGTAIFTGHLIGRAITYLRD
ncbi:MAG: hypothetical protein JSS32_01490 [Verrucomicrobia bacterium]|nr:hypothetical protein [Verrucomicrobiota bacterium]